MTFCIFSICSCSSYAENPKREFRGAWLHVIGPVAYSNMTPQQAQEYISRQLDLLQDAGCNAVIFQVRPAADALYKSELEPWSGYLTGKRGKAPSPLWDPMEYTIEEAHKRGMEFHAWLNPYRVTVNPKEVLPSDHPSVKEPKRYFKYNGQTFFNPAYEENMDFIASVVGDIVRRYDVDAIHIDDYFYPYPAKGQTIKDDAEYAKWGNGMSKADWRRDNVNRLIEKIHNTIKAEKSWVRFGVSPFGIHRNKRTDPSGSESTGLQNYDDLYADVLLWAKNGWIDYLAPQLYWELDHSAAPSRKLAQWWNDNANGVQLYIGQDTKRTMDKADAKTGDKNELATKMRLSRTLPNVDGNVWWHGYWVTDNYKGVADSLATHYQSTIAIPPAWGNQKIHPEKPENVKIVRRDGNTFITWDIPERDEKHQKESDVVKYVVYEFFPDEKQDINDPQAIIALTPYNWVRISDSDNKEDLKGITFAVTNIDRLNRESAPVFVRH